MERLMRVFLMACIGVVALSIAQIGFNTARYVDRIPTEPQPMLQRKSPPVERAATSTHATSTSPLDSAAMD